MALLQFVSCSSLSSKRSLFGSDEKEKKLETVPKSQYDHLLKKYEMVLNQKRDSHINGGPGTEGLLTKDVFEQKTPSDMVSELNKLDAKATGEQKGSLAETVDVFGKNNQRGRDNFSNKKATITANYEKINIEEQLEQFKKATLLMNQNKFDASLNEFKILESSEVRQISVRAKFNIGELLFRQNEYDLAMQVFQEILQNDAFSGLVIKTLGRLIVCSSKLKLKKKEEQYHSILHDFFEES